jgi:hypothetical protein
MKFAGNQKRLSFREIRSFRLSTKQAGPMLIGAGLCHAINAFVRDRRVVRRQKAGRQMAERLQTDARQAGAHPEVCSPEAASLGASLGAGQV